MSPLRYSFWILATALLTALGLGLANLQLTKRHAGDWFVLEKKIAALINSGQAAILPADFNESALRWSIAETLPAAPDAVIFGSSHGLIITQAMIGSARSMNLSISGASFFEHFVSSELLEQHALRPARRFIFVDPWLFDRGADSGAWRTRSAEFFSFQEKLRRQSPPELEPLVTAQASETFSFWKQVSLEPVARETDLRFNRWLLAVQPAPATPIDATVLAVDGAFQPGSEHFLITPEAVRALAEQQFSGNPDRHRYGNYPEVDELVWQYFERWVARCQRESEVVFILSPYHPGIHPRIAASPNNKTVAIEQRVREFASAKNIPVLGSYNPETAGIPAGEFADGDHLKPAGLQRLLKPLQAPLPADAAPAN